MLSISRSGARERLFGEGEALEARLSIRPDALMLRPRPRSDGSGSERVRRRGARVGCPGGDFHGWPGAAPGPGGDLLALRPRPLPSCSQRKASKAV